MARVLTLEEAQAIKTPSNVWLEESGGYEKTRYRAELIRATRVDSGSMMFGGSGMAWRAYNREICGWRLWDDNPSDTERLAAKWNKFYG